MLRRPQPRPRASTPRNQFSTALLKSLIVRRIAFQLLPVSLAIASWLIPSLKYRYAIVSTSLGGSPRPGERRAREVVESSHKSCSGSVARMACSVLCHSVSRCLSRSTGIPAVRPAVPTEHPHNLLIRQSQL